MHSWGEERANCELREKRGEEWNLRASREPGISAKTEQWTRDFTVKGCVETLRAPKNHLCLPGPKRGNEPGKQDEQGQPSGEV